jgi:hypothetical protein
MKTARTSATVLPATRKRRKTKKMKTMKMIMTTTTMTMGSTLMEGARAQAPLAVAARGHQHLIADQSPLRLAATATAPIIMAPTIMAALVAVMVAGTVGNIRPPTHGAAIEGDVMGLVY